MEPVTALRDAGHTAYLCSFSALDRYFELDAADRYVLTDSSLVDLAKVFDALEFPSHPMEDAAIVSDGVRYFFRCFDDVEPPPINAYAIQELLFDSSRDVFLDPHDVYRDIRRAELGSVHDGYPAWFVATEAARLVARYPVTVDLQAWQALDAVPGHVDAGMQRDVLFGVLSGGHADRGLELLRRVGLVKAWWPELAAMAQTAHTKDYHPEGNVWEHTLEALRHRKRPEPVLSLGLLLHDVGKPVSKPEGNHRFAAHAESGARLARRFLQRLDFPDSTVEAVFYLVRNHMMPAALTRLPEFRTAPVMSSPLFPELLELYRADTVSSYRSPEPYYEACRYYRSFMRRNGSEWNGEVRIGRARPAGLPNRNGHRSRRRRSRRRH